ncbi:MAG: phospholipase D-like domain-containing protein [Spirochaetaceae bacterium]|jgi:phosphatidylserine/phosphatidylglycerophosphate/cardiolipin synthase-like enzyme|nr:phospholipase D-like domain-containing protein [Spirochaetaceae bacterium]
MSVKLLKSPFEKSFKEVMRQTKREITISSPFINNAGVSILLDSIENVDNKRLNILTNLSARNVGDNITQPSALLKLYNAFKETTVYSLSKLHAKVYIVDESSAIITSANLTYGGLAANFEYGVLINDDDTIQNLKYDILAYASLGYIFDKLLLVQIEDISQKIEHSYVKNKPNEEEMELQKLLKRQQEVNKILVSKYDNKETRHGIFTKTIMYILNRKNEMTIQDLYSFVQEIHPEMCDDSIEYHKEKRWKIEVRQALFYWERKGIVKTEGKPGHYIWKLVSK